MILKQCSSREGFDSSSDDEYLDQQRNKYRTIEYYDECDQEEAKKQINSQSVQQCRNLTLNAPELKFNNSTIYLGQPFYNTQQIHQLIANKDYSNNFEFQPQILRPFLGMQKEGIQFNSNFESGNLDRVDQITNDEYNLFMRIDTNSIGHSNWFYFKTTNNKKNTIKFNICNFTKPQSLYAKGMKPYILSKKGAEKHFTQQGELIKYQQVGDLYVLSFFYSYEYPDDEVEFATLPPYTYTQLRRKIKKWHKQSKQYLTKLKLTNTLSGLVMPLLIITDKNSDKNKKVFIITARIHPSETCSSFMIQGFISFLLSDTFMASFLRKNIIFKIIPMLNPDGVIVGNFRNGLSGVDLNRQFLETDLTLLPEVKALKSLIQDNSTKLIGYLDFHGHQVRKNIFLYGPQTSNLNYDSKIFPLILQQRLESFRYKSCEFGIPKFKMGTARAFATYFVDVLCYTIEASFCGYQKGKSFKFLTKDWIQAGHCIGETLFLYFNFKQVNSKQIKQNQLIKLINEMSGKVEQTETKRESDDEKDSQSDAEIFEDYDKAKLITLQNQMKAELSEQNLVVINKGDSLRKRMKAQTVSRKIKIQPILIMNKNDQKKPLLYPELNIQNWEFSTKANQQIENKTPFIQKGNKNKISQSFRFVNSNRATSLKGTSPVNQPIQQINITQQIQPSNPLQISSKQPTNNFPILENNTQLSTPQYLPFITNLMKRKRIMTMN